MRIGFEAATTNGNAIASARQCHRARLRLCQRHGLSVSPTRRVRFAEQHHWGLAQGLSSGRSDASRLAAYGESYFVPAFMAAPFVANNCDHHQPRCTERSAHRKVQRRKLRRSPGEWLSLHRAVKRWSVRDFSLRRGSGAVVPYTELWRDRFKRWRPRAELQRAERERYKRRSGHAPCRYDRGQRHAADPSCATLAWAHDWVSNPALNAVFRTLPGASFVVNGAPIPADSALASVGAELHMTTRWSVLARFDGEFAKNSQTYAGTGTLRYIW